MPSSSDSTNHHTGVHRGDYWKYHAGQGLSSGDAKATTTNSQQQVENSKLMGRAKVWQHQEKTTSAYWSCDGAEEEGEPPEAASGGSSQVQEDSTPSAYDNLYGDSLLHTMEKVPTNRVDSVSPGTTVGMCDAEVDQEEVRKAGDSSSSWSSCEVLPLDENNDDLVATSPDIPPKKSKMMTLTQKAEKEIHNTDDHEDNEGEGNDDMHHPSSWASCSVISISPLSTGSSEVFLPSGPPDVQLQESQLKSRDTHSLVANLKQQMAQQKAEYRSRIER